MHRPLPSAIGTGLPVISFSTQARQRGRLQCAQQLCTRPPSPRLAVQGTSFVHEAHCSFMCFDRTNTSTPVACEAPWHTPLAKTSLSSFTHDA